MEVITALIGFVIGAITVFVILRNKLKPKDEPIGDLYLNNSELFLNLDEDIIGKKYITLRVVQLNSHK